MGRRPEREMEWVTEEEAIEFLMTRDKITRVEAELWLEEFYKHAAPGAVIEQEWKQ